MQSTGGANLPQPVPDIIVPLPSTPVTPVLDLPPPEVVEPPLPGGHFPFREPAWPVPQAFRRSSALLFDSTVRTALTAAIDGAH